jgi:hypothetical protein
MTKVRIEFIVLICILTLISIILLSISIYEFTKWKTFDPIESQCLVKDAFQLSSCSDSHRNTCSILSWTVSYVNELDGNKIKDLLSRIKMNGAPKESEAKEQLKQYQVIQYLVNFYDNVDNL